MSAVHVEQVIGAATYAESVCDVFDRDELTVSNDTHGATRVYPPGSWLHATQYDDGGNVVAYFESSAYADQCAARLREIRCEQRLTA